MADVMEKLKMRTYNGSLMHGKPKVLLVCSFEDEAIYGDEIAAEFFGSVDCSIWTVSDSAVLSPDEITELPEWFQLVVCLLTPRFFAIADDWPVPLLEESKKQRVPVLPLLAEPCSEVLYARYFGDLQYLNRCYEDPTSIPYAEKLKKYLSATLIDAHTAEKIRSAFDAYVFLSYRKKDRKYAQELMRLIHRYPFCRDIAIWYDEYLTPGEDFNHAIKDALNKCNLFALTVTPNLVNEDNFIRRIEYPLACSTQKPILPLEVVPTNRKQLEQEYHGLPACADPYDEKALETRLRQHIRTISLTGSSDFPEHLFFIGLAYLEGVDVETDHRKGVELITKAADAELPEAMQKLSHMYETGFGVERDYRTAAEWQKKLSRIIVKKAKVTLDEQLYDDAVSAALAYARLLHLAGADKEATEFLRELLHDVFMPESLAGRLSEIRLYTGSAKAADGNRDLHDAEVWSDTALVRAEKLYAEMPSPKTEAALAEGLETNILITWKNSPNRQEEKLERLIVLRRKAMSKDPTSRTAWALSTALNLLARFYVNKRSYENASSCLTEMQELLSAYSIKSMQPENRLKFVTVLQNQGIIAASVGKSGEAVLFFGSALKEANSIAQDTDSYSALESVASLHHILGYEAESRNEIAAAQEEYLKGLGVYRQLCDRELNKHMLLNMNKTLVALGKLAVKQNNPEEALEYFREAIFHVQANYSFEEGGFETLETTLLIADTLVHFQRFDEAEEMYRTVKESIEQYHETDYHRYLLQDKLERADKGLKRLTENV